MKKGYVEGYYGNLFSFNDRLKLLDDLGEYGLDTYFYCPKEDPNHRLNWQSRLQSDLDESFPGVILKCPV